jgi:hypothetical protein
MVHKSSNAENLPPSPPTAQAPPLVRTPSERLRDKLIRDSGRESRSAAAASSSGAGNVELEATAAEGGASDESDAKIKAAAGNNNRVETVSSAERQPANAPDGPSAKKGDQDCHELLIPSAEGAASNVPQSRPGAYAVPGMGVTAQGGGDAGRRDDDRSIFEVTAVAVPDEVEEDKDAVAVAVARESSLVDLIKQICRDRRVVAAVVLVAVAAIVLAVCGAVLWRSPGPAPSTEAPAVAKSHSSKSPTTVAPTLPPSPVPTGPAMFIPMGGDLNGESYSGTSVSLSGDGAAVAIGGVDDYEGSTGLFSAYQLTEGIAWTRLGQPVPGLDNGDGCCQTVSMSADGRTVAVGSPRSDRNGTNAGLVSVYQLIVGDDGLLSWRPLGDPILGLNGAGVSYEEDGGELFGWSVSLSADGSTLAVGAPLHNNVDFDRLGQVRIYRWEVSARQWQQLGPGVDDGDEFEYSEFGRSVSISGDGLTVAVGAPEYDSPYDHAGRVFAFQYHDNISSWVRLGRPLPGEGRLDRLGFAVALSRDGTTLAAGGPGNTPGEQIDTFEGAGVVRVHRLFGNDWAQVGQDIDGSLAKGAMGSSVALSDNGDIVAVGSPGSGPGHAQIYALNGDGTWTHVGADLVGEYPGDRFGASVSMSSGGNIVAVGGPNNMEGRDGPNGQVRIYKLARDVE